MAPVSPIREYMADGAPGSMLDSWRIPIMSIVGMGCLAGGILRDNAGLLVAGALGVGIPVLLLVVDFGLFTYERRHR
jgi:hypothetical protein